MRPALQLISNSERKPRDRAVAEAPFMEPSERRPWARRTTVLVVEEDVLVRLDIAEHLRDAGYRVIETSSAEEARAAIEGREPIALVFADVNQPGTWQGTDLSGWLHDRFPAVKVVLTSCAFHTIGGLKGCDRILPKPYLMDDVAQTVTGLLN